MTDHDIFALPSAAPDPEPASATAPFAPAILAVRWTTTLAAAIAVWAETASTPWSWAWVALLVANAAFRTWRPMPSSTDAGWRNLTLALFEVGLPLLAMATTGGWSSPFVFTLFSAIAVTGFARGFAFAMEAATVSALLLSGGYLAESATTERIISAVQWTLVLILVGLITGYARRMSGEADRQQTIALDRLSRLANANALLFSLHRVTQTLPASLDLDDVLDTTVDRIKTLFSVDFVAILLLDDSDPDAWHVAKKDGARVRPRFTGTELPAPVLSALSSHATLTVPDLAGAQQQGLGPKAASGVYSVLEARGAVIGMLVIENNEPNTYSARDVELVRGLVESVGLAIDNARWFSRLRTVGADEERTRIARDLHDRLGQSLAYLAFELDRLIEVVDSGEPINDRVERLRDDVRMVIREVRDTLYDLRTDVSDAQDLPSVLEAFSKRVEDRSNLAIELLCDTDERLPLLQEREMWRIAQEAITNVERHAHATKVRLVWRCNGDAAVLDITDDGKGFPLGKAGRLDSYGILGMRERATSIGATFEINSEEGRGTRVRCTLLHAAER